MSMSQVSSARRYTKRDQTSAPDRSATLYGSASDWICDVPDTHASFQPDTAVHVHHPRSPPARRLGSNDHTARSICITAPPLCTRCHHPFQLSCFRHQFYQMRNPIGIDDHWSMRSMSPAVGRWPGTADVSHGPQSPRAAARPEMLDASPLATDSDVHAQPPAASYRVCHWE